MTQNELKDRLQAFAIRIIKLTAKLPPDFIGKIIGGQIVRSGTSPGANYRAVCIAKSEKDFINKLKIVEEELDETIYWLEIISKTELIKPELLVGLIQENKELLAIIVASLKTARNNSNSKKKNE